jgi:hypothetical protein
MQGADRAYRDAAQASSGRSLRYRNQPLRMSECVCYGPGRKEFHMGTVPGRPWLARCRCRE